MIPGHALVLVCVLPKARDLEIARVLGWYRIPLRNAPKVISVDHLAFYQPASFGKSGGRIHFSAKVRGHELTTRKELLRDEPDHPHANEEYFKIQIGPLEPLQTPILPGAWKRFSFFYTTGDYINKATTLVDLAIRSEERMVLWKTLRERAARHSEYRVDLPEEPIDQGVLMALLGLVNMPTTNGGITK